MRDKFDIALDNALRSYTAVEPSPDLAERILRRTQQDAPSRNRMMAWAVMSALPIAAALVLAILSVIRFALPEPPPELASRPVPPVAAAAMAIRGLPNTRAPEFKAARQGRIPVRAHKYEIPAARFMPHALPYSTEELAVLAFVQQHPKEAAEISQVQKEDASSEKPISIAPLQIKPLTIAALNQEN
jgi:hypothetical protein